MKNRSNQISIKAQITEINEKIAERRIQWVPKSEYTMIKEFDGDKANLFLTKVII